MKKDSTEISNESLIFAFIFDSGRLGSAFYGDVVFRQMLKGKEVTKNASKIIISEGDIPIGKKVIDIEPYIINDDYCTVDFSESPLEFKDYPFCWVIEDLDYSIAQQIDKRLKNELTGYVGLTTIDKYSCDSRKQFWKQLCRDFSIKNDMITCFQDPDLTDVFCYWESAKDLGYSVQYEKNAEFASIDECDAIQSSVIKKDEDLTVLKGKNDVDRDLMTMNFTLGRELQIAGSLIWKAINDIDKVKFNRCFSLDDDECSLVEYPFMALYHASQGIERVQKIVIELIIKKDHLKISDKKKVYDLLMGHKHNALNMWIEQRSGINFKTSHRGIITLLQEFYNNIRYVRFLDSNNFASLTPEYKLLLKFGNFKNDTSRDDKIKSLFGKSLGEISHNYYNLICNLCGQLNIYVYELDAASAARFVFYNADSGQNLYTKLKHLQQGKKELLYWLMKNGKDFPKFSLATADALNFDEALVDEYLQELIFNPEDGQELFDELDFLYDELCAGDKASWRSRKELVDAIIANPSVQILDDDEDLDD